MCAILLLNALMTGLFLNRSRFDLLGAGYFRDSAKIYHALRHGELPSGDREIIPNQPPLVLVAAALAYFPFGLSKETAIMFNIFYLAMLIFGTYLFAFGLYGPRAAFLSAVLASFVPAVYGHAHTFLLDLPLASFTMSALGIASYTKLNSVPGRIAAGSAIACGLLTKWTFPLFFMPLFAVLIVAGRVRLLDSAVTFIIGMIPALPWYIIHRRDVLAILKYGSAVISPELSGYVPFLYEKLLLPPLAVIFAVSIIYSLIRKRFLLLMLSAAIPVCLISFSKNRDPRQILPAIPVMMVIVGSVLAEADRKGITASIVLLFSFTQFLLLHFKPGFLPYLENFSHVPADGQFGLYTPVNTGYWKTMEIFNAIRRAARRERRMSILVISPHSGLIHPLENLAAVNDFSIELHAPADRDQLKVTFEVDVVRLINEADYVMYKSGHQGNTWHQNIIDELYRVFDNKRREFVLELNETLPDGSELFLFRRQLILQKK